MTRFAIFLVRAYQRLLSPVLGGRCRFHPSCSAYAIEYLQTHGVLAALIAIPWRLLRCAPWGGSGEDRVPERAFELPPLRGPR
jgi:putative membrane protein insertion efficiency factor